MTSDATPGRPYHHGALRAALLDGARAMLAERGPDRFSLNALAAKIGVSTAAPYRHFADKDALLDALADEGYATFGAALDAAVEAASNPRDRLVGLGVAYLRFAADHPAVFTIMFRERAGRPDLAGPPTFQPLIAAVEDARASGDLPAELPTLVLARTIWATLHGIAVLESRGGLSKLGLGASHEQLAAEAFALMLR